MGALWGVVPSEGEGNKLGQGGKVGGVGVRPRRATTTIKERVTAKIRKLIK